MRLALLMAGALALVSPGALAQDAGAPPAQAAQESAKAEVIVLHATNDGSGIDPKCGSMPELTKPPFSAYNSYKCVAKNQLALAKGQAQSSKLPNGRDLRVTLIDVIAAKAAPKKYVVDASIQTPDGKAFLPLLKVNAKSGETFFVAGQSHKGGILVIGIKILA